MKAKTTTKKTKSNSFMRWLMCSIILLGLSATNLNGQTVLMTDNFEAATAGTTGTWTSNNFGTLAFFPYNKFFVQSGCAANLITGTLTMMVTGVTNAGATCAYQNIAPANNPGFVAYTYKSVSASGFNNILLSYKWKCLGQGTVGSPVDFGNLIYSINGGTTWNVIGSALVGQSTTQTVTNQSLSTATGNAVDNTTFLIGWKFTANNVTVGSPGLSLDDITITGTAVGCAGAPTPGNTLTSTVSACSTTNINLSMQNPSGAIGIINQWQSAPDVAGAPGSWTNIGGGLTTLTTTETATTWYRCQVTCSNSSTTVASNPVEVFYSNFCYCYPTMFNGANTCSFINSVSTSGGAANITSPGDAGFTNNVGPGINYFNSSVTQQAGSSFTLSVQAQGACALAYFSVWADWDQNGTFDAGELMVNNVSCANTLTNFTINIPPSAVVGTTRMRIIDWTAGTAPAPCGTLSANFGETEDYLVNVTAAPPCSGTPTAGTANSTLGGVCTSATSFTLSLAGTSGGAGLAYQWQSSPNNSSWTNISGGTSASLATTETAATYFRCVVTCTNTSSSSNSTSVLVNFNNTGQCGTYCQPAYSTGTGSGDYLTLVQIATTTLSNITGASTTPFYTLYPYSGSTTATLTAGNTYTLTLSAGTYTSNDIAAWIDFNQNGVLNDAGEKLGEVDNIAAGPATATITFTVPLNTISGSFRLRVREADQTTTGGMEPCNTSNITAFGETEDYIITINPAIPCSGTPAPGNTVLATGTNPTCSSVAFSLGIQNALLFSGITYQWQSSTDNLTYSNISGATSATYATSEMVATYYRCAVTCANGSSSANSTPLLVGVNSSFASCYCTSPTYSLGTQACANNFGITNVNFAGINNTSVCNGTSPYFTYYSALTATMAQTNTYSISITSLGTMSFASWIKIYIDYNDNGVFDDTGELIFNTGNINGVAPPFTGSFTVPLTAPLGTHRMRVRLADGDVNSCSQDGIVGEVEDYNVNIGVPPPCAGTPAPGNTILSTGNLVCSSSAISLSLQTPTPGTGVTYQWQSSSNNITYSNIVSATSPTLSTTTTASTYYRCTVTCSGNTGISNPVQVYYNPICYCTSPLYSGGSGCSVNGGLVNVNFGGINNTTSCNSATPFYTYFPLTGNVTQGSSYTFSASTGGTPTFLTYVKVYIDYNDNGSFDDSGELVYNSGNVGGIAPPYTGTVIIPASANIGTHLMRVRSMDADVNSCSGDGSEGETEDYLIQVNCFAPTANAGGPIAAICQGGTSASLGGSFGGAAVSAIWSDGGAGGTFANNTGSTPGAATYTAALNSPLSVTLTLTASGGSCGPATANNVITVNPLPAGSASPQTICSGATTSVGLSSTITGSTFTWTATVISGNVTGLGGCNSSCGTTIAQALINTSNSLTGVVRYTVTPTSPLGCVGNPFTVDVTVNPKPSGSTSNSAICSGGATNILLNSTISGTTFAWSGANQSGSSSGFSSGIGTPIIQTLTDNSNSTASIVRYTIVPTSPAGCTGANFLSDVTVNPTPVASSSVDPGEFLCDGNSTNIDLNSSTSGSSSYTWTSTADAGISGNSNCSSGCLNPIADVLSNTGSVNGTVTYSIIPTSGAGCVGGVYTITETVGATPVGSGSSIVICNGDPTNVPLTSSIAGTEFTWVSSVITGSVIGNQDCPGGCGTTIADVLTNTSNVHGVVEYTVSPVSADGCPGADFIIDVTVGAAPAMPVISGPSVVCNMSTATYSVAPVPEATSYTWTVPTGVTGMTITSGQGTNSITVNISAGTVIGNVTCTASNNCGSSQTASMAVTKKPAVPGPISGPTSTCGQTSATYFIASVFGATSYAWTVPAGMTITSGQGGLTITVSISSTFVSGLVKVSAVNACGNVPGISLLVFGNVPPIPVSISGPTAVCGLTSATYSVPAVAGATGYNWTITGAGTIVGSNTGSSVTVALSGTSPGTISCSATNVCGTGTPRSLNLTTTPATPGTISGPTVACGLFTATYTVPAVAGTTYNWTLQTAVGCFGTSFPGGPQTATGTTVTVAFSPNFMNAMSGVLSVTATTQCGTSNPSNLIIFQNQTPTTLNGPANVTGLQQATYFTSPMNGAIDYVWTTTSTGGQITINGTTATTVITPSLSITAFFTGQSGVYSGTGQIKVAARYSCVDRATQTSGYKTVPISGVALNPNAMANNTDLRSVFSEIYPNPASTEFTIDVTSDGDRNIVVEVFDVLGNMAIEQKHYLMAGEVAFKTNVETLEKGMYFVRITDVEGNVLYTQRVIKE